MQEGQVPKIKLRLGQPQPHLPAQQHEIPPPAQQLSTPLAETTAQVPSSGPDASIQPPPAVPPAAQVTPSAAPAPIEKKKRAPAKKKEPGPGKAWRKGVKGGAKSVQSDPDGHASYQPEDDLDSKPKPRPRTKKAKAADTGVTPELGTNKITVPFLPKTPRPRQWHHRKLPITNIYGKSLDLATYKADSYSPLLDYLQRDTSMTPALTEVPVPTLSTGKSTRKTPARLQELYSATAADQADLSQPEYPPSSAQTPALLTPSPSHPPPQPLPAHFPPTSEAMHPQGYPPTTLGAYPWPSPVPLQSHHGPAPQPFPVPDANGIPPLMPAPHPADQFYSASSPVSAFHSPTTGKPTTPLRLPPISALTAPPMAELTAYPSAYALPPM